MKNIRLEALTAALESSIQGKSQRLAGTCCKRLHSLPARHLDTSILARDGLLGNVVRHAVLQPAGYVHQEGHAEVVHANIAPVVSQ